MTADRANLDRWRTDIDEAEQEKLTHDYGKALERLVADGIAVAPDLATRGIADLEPSRGGGTGSRLGAVGWVVCAEVSAPPPLFVGGTGRSGTHAVAKLLGRHSQLLLRLARAPLPHRPGRLSGSALRA